MAELLDKEATRQLDVSMHQFDVHEKYSIDLKLHVQLNYSLVHQACIRHLQASNAEFSLLHDSWT